MSNRIDELVAAIDANTLLQWDSKDVALLAAHELATIARENAAEADKWRKVAEEARLLLRDAILAEPEWWESVMAIYAAESDDRMTTGARALATAARNVAAALAAIEQEEAE